MKTTIKKFLEFNGKTIHFLSVEGIYWIALRPICEALGIDAKWQIKALKDDPIFGREGREHTLHDASGRLQKMVCLPEKYIYGWLSDIKFSNTMPDATKLNLIEYKRKCYDLLYDYFHGSVTGRENLLKEKAITDLEIKKIKNRIGENEDYLQLTELQDKQKKISASLKQLDKEVIKTQTELFADSDSI